eukprot:3304632-Amphidinium_carterae.1
MTTVWQKARTAMCVVVRKLKGYWSPRLDLGRVDHDSFRSRLNLGEVGMEKMQTEWDGATARGSSHVPGSRETGAMSYTDVMVAEAQHAQGLIDE